VYVRNLLEDRKFQPWFDFSPQIPMDDVTKSVSAKTKMSEAEIMSCIEHMSNDNKIMLASGILYLI
jgi:hypothetical protein